jgi:hypothetical protein
MVLFDEKKLQLTTQVYVQVAEGKFSNNHPEGAPGRAMSLATSITRVL